MPVLLQNKHGKWRCRAGAKVSVGPNDCLRFVETPAMLRRGRQLDPLEARHGRQVTEIETKEPEAKGHRQRPIQEDQRRSDRCQGKEAGLAVDTRTPSCPIKFPSRHLDGELRVSLSRGRLTRWTRSGFSDGELLCSSLAQRRIPSRPRSWHLGSGDSRTAQRVAANRSAR